MTLFVAGVRNMLGGGENKKVVGARIELATQGFSVLRSTN